MLRFILSIQGNPNIKRNFLDFLLLLLLSLMCVHFFISSKSVTALSFNWFTHYPPNKTKLCPSMAYLDLHQMFSEKRVCSAVTPPVFVWAGGGWGEVILVVVCNFSWHVLLLSCSILKADACKLIWDVWFVTVQAGMFCFPWLITLKGQEWAC